MIFVFCCTRYLSPLLFGRIRPLHLCPPTSPSCHLHHLTPPALPLCLSVEAITACGKAHQWEQAVTLLREMAAVGVDPDAITYQERGSCDCWLLFVFLYFFFRFYVSLRATYMFFVCSCMNSYFFSCACVRFFVCFRYVRVFVGCTRAFLCVLCVRF